MQREMRLIKVCLIEPNPINPNQIIQGVFKNVQGDEQGKVYHMLTGVRQEDGVVLRQPFTLDENGQACVDVSALLKTKSKQIDLNSKVDGPIEGILGKAWTQERLKCFEVSTDEFMHGCCKKFALSKNCYVVLSISDMKQQQVGAQCHAQNASRSTIPMGLNINITSQHTYPGIRKAEERELQTLFALVTGSTLIPQTQDELNEFMQKNPHINPEDIKGIFILGINLKISMEDKINMQSLLPSTVTIINDKVNEMQTASEFNTRAYMLVLDIGTQLINKHNLHNMSTKNMINWIQANANEVEARTLLGRQLNTQMMYRFDAAPDPNKQIISQDGVEFGLSANCDHQKATIKDLPAALRDFDIVMAQIKNKEYLQYDKDGNVLRDELGKEKICWLTCGNMLSTVRTIIGDCEDGTAGHKLLDKGMKQIAFATNAQIDRKNTELTSIGNEIYAQLKNADVVRTLAQVMTKHTVATTIGFAGAANAIDLKQDVHKAVSENIPENSTAYMKQYCEQLMLKAEGGGVGGHCYGTQLVQDKNTPTFTAVCPETGCKVQIKEVKGIKVMESTAEKLTLSKNMQAKCDVQFNVEASAIPKNMTMNQIGSDVQSLQTKVQSLNRQKVPLKDAMNILSNIQKQVLSRNNELKGVGAVIVNTSDDEPVFYDTHLRAGKQILAMINAAGMEKLRKKSGLNSFNSQANAFSSQECVRHIDIKDLPEIFKEHMAFGVPAANCPHDVRMCTIDVIQTNSARDKECEEAAARWFSLAATPDDIHGLQEKVRVELEKAVGDSIEEEWKDYLKFTRRGVVDYAMSADELKNMTRCDGVFETDILNTMRNTPQGIKEQLKLGKIDNALRIGPYFYLVSKAVK